MSALPPLPASDLLIADRPLLVMPRLVALVGLNEAIVLQQIRYWLGDDLRPQVRDGRRWVYNSYRAWQERNFPFWQVDTVKRAFLSLERQGLLLSANYNRNRRNHTKWYTVDFDRLRELDRLYRAASGAPPAPRTPPSAPAPAGLPSILATDLLLDEHPLLILPRLAALVGFDEALILQQVRYWLADARRPPVRDGRRWVRFTREEWHEQFPFRSVATLARAFRTLERLGLLIACDRYNHEPGDRTKWYTIDFERVAALAAAGQGGGQEPREAEDTPGAQSAPYQEINLPRPVAQDAPAEPGDLPRPAPPDAPARGAARPDQGDDLPGSWTETSPKTSTETEPEKQQPGLMPPLAGVVVVVDPPEVLIACLTERGLAPRAARHLTATRDATLIARQLEIFDWLRDAAPEDPRYSPGRLRRMIEEDWAPPPGFVPAAERARRTSLAATAAEEERHRQETAREAARARDRATATAEAEFLVPLGLAADDQAVWRALVERPPRLPAAFGRALFYPPGAATPPVVIFPRPADRELAAGATYRHHRADLERRLRDRFPRYASQPAGRVLYVAYDDALAALRAHGDAPDGGGAPTLRGR